MLSIHPPIPPTMDAFDELPDNFDQAYTLFSQMYGEAKGLGNANNATTPGNTDALLNDQEQEVFTKFLDNVLDDPKGAAESSEIKWLDQHFSAPPATGGYTTAPPMVPPTHQYPVESRQSNDFYRGFREINNDWAPVLPGQHPQMSSSTSNVVPVVPQSAAVGVIGAHGHIVPPVPANYDSKGYELKTYSHPPATQLGAVHHQQPPALQGVHISTSTGPQFSAAHAFSSACLAHAVARTHSPNQSPHQLEDTDPAAEPETKRSRTSPPEPLPTPTHTPIPKKKKEFLSETQVRINHVNSEKRRRDLISHNFKSMCALVPSIQAAPPSLPKATVLQNVYDFLLEIADENKTLRAQLESSGVNCDGIQKHKLGEKLAEQPEDL